VTKRKRESSSDQDVKEKPIRWSRELTDPKQQKIKVTSAIEIWAGDEIATSMAVGVAVGFGKAPDEIID